MHITILALGSRGDIQPYANLGRGLKQAGHQVRFITFESFATLIAENELDFHPILGNAQSLVAGAGADMLALIRSFGSLAQGYARDLSDPKLGDTDLILNQLPAGLYGYDLAEKYNVPLLLASVIPLARTNAFPVMGFPNLPLPGYNKLTYLIGEQMAWGMFRSIINRWRTQTLNLPVHRLGGYFSKLGTNRIPILNGFSPNVVQRPTDWGADIHVTGYWFPEKQEWQPPTDLQAFIQGGPPPVFVGFGSMPIKDPAHTTDLILESLRQSGQRAILHMGWGGLGERALPESVHKIEYAPYEWLFPQMALTIHHGGSGTTAFALAAGVPSLVVSFVFDQHYWGEQIYRLGAGPRPIRYSNLSVEKLKNAIIESVGNAPMQQRAAKLGRHIRAETGIANARQIIEDKLPHG